MKTDRPDSPGVWPPPPAYLLAGLAAGWAGSRLAPFSLLPQATARNAGAALLAAGFLLVAWALASFLRAGTNPRPDRPSTVLFTGGPFRFSRNPMYVGGLLAYCGTAVWMQWWLAIALCPAVVLVVSRRVIAKEEAYMERKFGTQYLEYRQRTRRWL